jgi:hypothetical protein
MPEIQPQVTADVNCCCRSAGVYVKMWLGCGSLMEEPRFLPHLAAACCLILGDEDAEKIPPHVRAEVAVHAKVSEMTVKRFLKGANVPRGRDLDQMVAAVAVVGKKDWTLPWRDATHRAERATVEWSRFLSGDLAIAPDPTLGKEPGGEKPQRRRR